MEKVVYPVILNEDKKDKIPFYVSVPDLGIHTQGKDLADAIAMARDAINIQIVAMEDEGRLIPEPNKKKYELEEGDFVTMVDADPARYRKELSNLSVKKNCTIPQWLAIKAEEAGINFSQVLQEALKAKLNIA